MLREEPLPWKGADLTESFFVAQFQDQHQSIIPSHLEPLVCGIKQQFNPILGHVEHEVMAEWRLEEIKVIKGKLGGPSSGPGMQSSTASVWTDGDDFRQTEERHSFYSFHLNTNGSSLNPECEILQFSSNLHSSLSFWLLYHEV